MKRNKYIILLVLLTFFAVCFSTTAAAKQQNSVTATLDAKVYTIIPVDQIIASFSNNQKAAIEKYKNKKIAISGCVESKEEDLKSLHLKNNDESSKLEIICKFSDKSFVDQLGKIESGCIILVSGKVIRAKGDLLIIDGVILQTLNEKRVEDLSGKVDAYGTIYETESLGENTLPGIKYCYLKKWTPFNISWFNTYQLGKSEDAVHYDLGDDEFIDLYSLDWDKLVRTAKSVDNRREDFHFYTGNTERVIDYLTGDLAPGVCVLPNNIGKLNTNDRSFKYQVCTNRVNGAICVEEFFTKIDDRYIVLTYYHNDDAIHVKEVAFFLGGIVADK